MLKFRPGEFRFMCLAIPGKVVEIVDADNHIAKVEIGGVRRAVNYAMIDDVVLGDYVLIHVGFAMSKIDEIEALKTLNLLRELGSYEEEFEQFQTTID